MVNKGYKQTKEHIKKRIIPHIGSKRSMESRQRMKEKRRRFFENGGQIWNKNRPRTELEKQHISEAIKKAMARPEVKEKLIQSHRKLKSFGKVSSLEKIFRDEFKKRGINFEWNYETTFGIKETYFNRIYFHKADFYLSDKNLIIEINGCYWHGCPIHYPNPSERQKARITRDNDLKQYILGQGFNMLVIWEHEIKDKIHQINVNADKMKNVIDSIMREDSRAEDGEVVKWSNL